MVKSGVVLCIAAMLFPLSSLAADQMAADASERDRSDRDHAHHSDHGHGHHGHHQHGVLDVSGPDAPSVQLTVTVDPMSGWNIQAAPQNFRFAPQNASGPHVDGEGHGHLYVNGEKIARLYSPWFHLAQLPPGEHTIRVTLNSNDHSDLVVDGKIVEASARISVPSLSN